MINDKYTSDFARRLSLSDDLQDFAIHLKIKLDALAGKHPAVLQYLSPKFRQRVEVLRDYQRQHNDLEAEFFKEKAALKDKYSKRQHNDLEAEFFKEKATLEDKYQKKYEHLYSKRCDIVTGVVEVEGVKSEAAVDNKEDKATEERGVPFFWCRAMKINKILCEEISMRDEKALKFLEDIKWHRIDDHKGFKLEFFFGLNPFFKNSVLTKTYHMIDDHDGLFLEKAIGTEIEWLPGKSLTQKVLKEKPKKGSENAKPITETESCESFFNFVNPPQVPEEEDDIDEDDITETESSESFFNFFYPPQVPEEDDIETTEMFENQMKHDYDIGSTIRYEIIPHAVSWFTGEANQGDESEDDEKDDDMEDGDYEDDKGW